MKKNAKLERLLQTYNKLEALHKTSQLAMLHFMAPIMNEHRYFARALVDYCLLDFAPDNSEKIPKQDEAISRAEVALSSLLNDVVDSVVNHIKKTAKDIREKFWMANIAKHFNSFSYSKVLDSIDIADAMIVASREARGKRFDDYCLFVNSEHFNTLIEFALRIPQLEYICEIDSTPGKKRQLEMIEAMRIALLDNKSTSDQPFKFDLYIQPKFSGPKEQIVGAEALLRLHKTEKKQTLTPDHFLNLAHRAYMTNDIGMWVLEKAINTIKSWNDNGLLPQGFDLAINISPTQLAGDNFASTFREKVVSSGIPRDSLSIEITEDWIFNEEQHIDVNHRLGDLCAETKVAVDDFGTGSTRIEYISRIERLSTIKIDKCLIDSLHSKNQNRTKNFISGIVALAKKNGLTTVAEGVQERDQFDVLVNEIGVDHIQGYLVGKPMPINEFEALLKEASQQSSPVV